MRSIFHTNSVFHNSKKYFTHSEGMNFIERTSLVSQVRFFPGAGDGTFFSRTEAPPGLLPVFTQQQAARQKQKLVSSPII